MEDKAQTLKRMNYLVGHLKGVAKMLEDGRYCIDIIEQNNAVIAALKKVNEKILAGHLETCVKSAIESKDVKRQKKIFNELMEIYKKEA